MTAAATPVQTYRPPPPSATFRGAGSANGSRVLLLHLCLRGITAASRRVLEKLALAYFQSSVLPVLHAVVAGLRIRSRPGAREADDPRTGDATPASPPRQAASPKKASWSYLRGTCALSLSRSYSCSPASVVGWRAETTSSSFVGISLALSDLCQDHRYGGGRIPLPAILDLMREHQSAFVPLGPHVERDVPKRLIQLANENIIFFDPFEDYVIVLEETRQKYVSRRQELLAEGVDPADLSVFGAALTQDMSPSRRLTNAAVQSYKEQFLLARRQKTARRRSRAPTREESLVSIADAVRPSGLEAESAPSEGSGCVRRGHSLVMDMADIVGCLWERVGRSARQGDKLRRGLGYSVLPEMSAIIHERDALEVENNRLRAILGSRVVDRVQLGSR
ncbi:hypothetical protein F5148DRAFT_345274 [Russula earlei]|uniref:Uncharacterized protein n=1 Tax=Russula earlei TaxID=71964 RepID=A0ACC0UJA2_9AGAM|nr:hypothetical protein F5148DRAFT_345274 [Russula earlei]